MAAVSSINPLL